MYLAISHFGFEGRSWSFSSFIFSHVNCLVCLCYSRIVNTVMKRTCAPLPASADNIIPCLGGLNTSPWRSRHLSYFPKSSSCGEEIKSRVCNAIIFSGQFTLYFVKLFFIALLIVCVCVVQVNVIFNNLSVVSRWCLVATGVELSAYFYRQSVLPHCDIKSQTLYLIPFAVTFY